MLVTNVRQGDHRHLQFADRPPGDAMLFRDHGIEGRDVLVVLHDKERQLVRSVPDGRVKVDISWPRAGEPGKPARRLDVDTAPAAIIECPGHRVVIWMRGSQIDIKTAFDVPERTPEHHVFKILGI